MSDERVWEDMRERLMGLRVKDLKKIARDEHITLGYAASRKDTLVGEIVSQRRHRALHQEESAQRGEGSPWRAFRSVERMGAGK